MLRRAGGPRPRGHRRAPLVLGPGMTAVTGETGAGKTLVVEAIELLVGGRADPAMVRHGADEAVVEGRFVRRRRRGRPAPGRAQRGPVAGLRRRPPGHGRRRWPSRAPTSSTSTASTTTSRCWPPAVQREALDRFGGDRPRAAARRPARLAVGPSTSAWPSSAATSGTGPARSTCCASRSTSSTPPASTTPTRTTRLEAEEDLLADAAGPPGGGGAAPSLALDVDGGAGGVAGRGHRRARRAAPRSPRAGRRGCAASPPSSPTSPPSCGPPARRIEEDPERQADGPRAPAAPARPAAQVRRHRWPTSSSSAARPPRRLAELEDHDRAGRRARRRAGRRGRPRSRRPSGVVGAARRAAAPDAGRGHRGPPARAGHAQGPHRGRRSATIPATTCAFLLAANPGAPPLPLAKVASGGELARSMLALRLVLTERARHAGVRRGRRRHRRHRGQRRRSGAGRAGRATTRCWSSPTWPRSRRSPTPRSGAQGRATGHDHDVGAPARPGRAGRRDRPDAVRLARQRRRPGSTPRSC